MYWLSSRRRSIQSSLDVVHVGEVLYADVVNAIHKLSHGRMFGFEGFFEASIERFQRVVGAILDNVGIVRC